MKPISQETAKAIGTITQAEADRLHGLGWNSGFGWADQRDWYHRPSAGDDIWIDDDPKWMAVFLEDLRVIRRDAEIARQKEAGPALYEALEEVRNYQGGADSALEDPYVMERVDAALSLARMEQDNG